MYDIHGFCFCIDGATLKDLHADVKDNLLLALYNTRTTSADPQPTTSADSQPPSSLPAAALSVCIQRQINSHGYSDAVKSSKWPTGSESPFKMMASTQQQVDTNQMLLQGLQKMLSKHSDKQQEMHQLVKTTANATTKLAESAHVAATCAASSAGRPPQATPSARSQSRQSMSKAFTCSFEDLFHLPYPTTSAR